jgi:hypothetical protein
MTKEKAEYLLQCQDSFCLLYYLTSPWLQQNRIKRLKVKHFFEMSPELFANAAVDDEVDGGVGRQEEVVHVGKQI